MRIAFLIVSIIAISFGYSAHAENNVGDNDITFVASDALKKSGFPLSTAVEADGWIFLPARSERFRAKGS